jgi:putative SOS response-associated peptidase YedK
MCGRYEIIDGKRVFIRFRVANAAPEVLTNLDVRPTQQVPILLVDHQLTLMEWGVAPRWTRANAGAAGKPLINARAEDIERKQTWRGPLVTGRCLFLASAFFEWGGPKGRRVKYRIARRDGDMFAMAGLYVVEAGADGGDLRSCAIVTCAPNDLVLPIHDRMPSLLLPEEEDDWLNPDMTEVAEIKRYLRPYPADLLEATPA